MIDRIKGLDKSAKIRLGLFIALLIWCIYLGASCFIGKDGGNIMASGLDENMVDPSEVGDVSIDGADFSPLVRLLGSGLNGLFAFIYVIVIAVFFLVIAFLSAVPTLVLRFVGLRKKFYVTEDEYKLTKYLYFIAIVIGLLLNLILTRFVGIIPCILLTLSWTLIVLIYVIGVKKRYKLYALSQERGVSYEQLVGIAPSNQSVNPMKEYDYYKNDTYPFTDNLKEFPPKE